MARTSGKTDFDKNLVRIGDAIRELRQNAGISQEELANLAGMDRSHVGRIERGERNVTMLNIIKLADVLEEKPSAILAHAEL